MNTALQNRRIAAPADPRPPRAAFAWLPVAAVAVVTAAALVVEAARQAYHGDELYFLAAAQHLSWGYADQGFLVPFLAWVAEAGGGSPLALRAPAIAATVVGVVLAALLAREFGGGRWAQVATAAVSAAAPRVVDTGSLLATQTFDIPLWIATTWLLVRWARTRADRLWWGMGAVAGFAFTAKPLIAVFWVCCVAVLVVSTRNPALVPNVGRLVALGGLGVLPYLIWQWAHGFPQATLVPVVAQETGQFAGGKAAVLPLTLLSNGALAGAALAVYGCWVLLRNPRYRFLGWTVLAVTAVMLVAGGRYYYCAGLFPACWAAAATHLAGTRGAWRKAASVGVSAATGAVLLVTSLVATGPAWATAATLEVRAEQGWPAFTDAVAQAYATLPAGATVVTAHYWQASAVNWFGPGLGLPPAYSPHRGFADFGTPSDTGGPVLYVGTDPTPLHTHCVRESVTPAQPGHGFDGLNQGVPIWVCAAPAQPWSVLWPRLRHS
ncbi:glycosyltransferase family 39 protein [Amycolatopsis rhabdoformis]|uniref:Glycosyltransferase family 39 protein n=1 Tax=Amycolatopsis rhabdoformis TaxID=1448059 RepID=A0ABZ1IEA9_9PSEU|nr:glycosyltransferase family 39 protein [Amycolatopsis rhabdoformis]WSE32602.1 glycosyltransferase family 39 protein [Amycolatopsis rhabdoformis]